MQRIATGMSLVSLAVGFSILGALIIMKRDYAELNGVADGSSIALIGMLANTCIESTGRFADGARPPRRRALRQAHPKNQKQTNMPTNTKEIRLIASMIVVPGKENELREVLRSLIGPTRNEPGCRRYQMYESEQKGRYFADEIWESREALDAHLQSAHFKRAAAAFPELLQGALGIDILGEIAT